MYFTSRTCSRVCFRARSILHKQTISKISYLHSCVQCEMSSINPRIECEMSSNKTMRWMRNKLKIQMRPMQNEFNKTMSRMRMSKSLLHGLEYPNSRRNRFSNGFESLARCAAISIKLNKPFIEIAFNDSARWVTKSIKVHTEAGQENLDVCF